MSIKEWFKENWAFVGVLLFAIGIRIYYFVLTNGQPCWWDECEYLNIAQRFAFGTDYSFGPVRPILFSFLSAGFLKIVSGELLPRLFVLFMSVLSVVGIYYLGKEIYGKTTGLVASFFMSVFYLGLFFTYRLLVDLPGMVFFIFSALFFYKYCKEKLPKYLYLTAGILAVGTLFKLSTAFILVPFVIMALITFKGEIFKRKETWISAGLFLLILAPYIIWGYSEFGGFVLTQAAGHVAPENYLQQGWGNLKGYLNNFSTYFTWWILIPFIAGLLFMFQKKSKGGNWTRDIYSLLLLLLPLILISLTVNHVEDRYIFIVFPAVFLIAGSFIEGLYNILKEKKEIVAIFFIILFFAVVATTQIISADALIKNKLHSYEDVQSAGLWLKDNSNSTDIIATKSQPQMRYYSGLKTIGLPPTEEEFEKQLNPDVRFFMISVFEAHPEWAFSYPIKKNLTMEKAFITPDQRATLIIYKLK